MSGTDKTDPWSVRLGFRPAWVVEAHDHSVGPCSLPERADRDDRTAFGWQPRGACAWVPAPGAWFEAGPACGCEMCRGSFGSRAVRRRDRHRAVVSARSLVRWVNSGEDLDEVPW